MGATARGWHGQSLHRCAPCGPCDDATVVAGEAAGQAYLAGLMSFRTPAPPVIPARLGDEAPLVGAAENAFSLALSEEGLKNWITREPGEG